MLKRLIALLFIFVIAGQVSACVCGCLGAESQPRHSCCKRQKPDRDAVRRKGCCDEDCALRQAERLPQDRTNSVAKITYKAEAELITLSLVSFAPITAQNLALAAAVTDHRIKYSRPPDLYLRHHAFLI